MSEQYYSYNPASGAFEPKKPKPRKRIWLNVALFVATFFTCVMAGILWMNKDPLDPANFGAGVPYAILILTFLSAHEFGHYFAAKYHKVDATMPYYIPVPLPFFINFGTFGAIIKTLEPIRSRKALFDIGVAGPLAGFVVCVIFLAIGFATLPPIDYLYAIHPEYLLLYGGQIPNVSLHFGDALAYSALSELFANPDGFNPPMNEVYHYPFLNVGWFGLFVTALNLLPMGQLDGGHIIYSMFGKKHKIIAKIAWNAIFIIGVGSLLGVFYDYMRDAPTGGFFGGFFSVLTPPLAWIDQNMNFVYQGWAGWLFWALITRVFIKLEHPPIFDYKELGPGRKAVGWAALAVFILCFSYNGIYFIE